MRLSAKQYREIILNENQNNIKKTRNNKYGAKPKTIKMNDEDIFFHSSGEAQRYIELSLKEKAGIIHELKRQVKIPLIVNDQHISIEDKNGRLRKLNYIADFTYKANDKMIIEDWKGFDTPVSRLKRAIVKAIIGYPVMITGPSKK